MSYTDELIGAAGYYARADNVHPKPSAVAITGAIGPITIIDAGVAPHCPTCRCDGATDAGSAPDLGSATNPDSDPAT
jgi:hypothetical protein